MQKTRATKPTSTSTGEEPTAPSVTVGDLDALLDEIDAVLEDNALEVVRMYLQRGGE